VTLHIQPGGALRVGQAGEGTEIRSGEKRAIRVEEPKGACFCAGQRDGARGRRGGGGSRETGGSGGREDCRSVRGSSL